jgi:mono/diheme cytochrome c family protein
MSVRATIVLICVLACAGCADSGGTRSVVQAGPTTLQAVQTAVFTPNCAMSGCHTSGGAFGLDLSNGQSYGNTFEFSSVEVPAFERVDPFDADNSYLYMKITGDPRILGDPMPLSGPMLTPEQVQLVADWINAGALP